MGGSLWYLGMIFNYWRLDDSLHELKLTFATTLANVMDGFGDSFLELSA